MSSWPWKEIVTDTALVAGASLVVAGVSVVYMPAGLIVAGMFCLAVGVRLSM